MGRPRRASSNLGADPPGDTTGPAISTLIFTPPSSAAIASAEREKALRPHSKRRKARSALRRWKAISLRHTWLNPLILILVVLSLYAVNPTPKNPLHSAIFLSYPRPPASSDGPTMYGKGKQDISFVAFYTIVLSFTREFLMQRLIRPLAIRAGIRSRAKQSRFMEQVYTAIYFAVFGPFGLYVMSRGPLWYFDTTAMFEGFPHRVHEGVFKAYYLLQASYWSQQAIVLLLQLEKPRKDFKELVLHHIVTLALIGLSYRFHFTYMGIAVYITHDISDFFLATSKTLNYLDSSIVGPYFVFFIGIWVYLRHYLNLCILFATLTKFRTVGPFELDWETQQYKCWISQYITFSLLACLQAVNLFWLFLILRIAKNYVFRVGLADERSDNEETELEEDDVRGNEGDTIVVKRKGEEKAKGLLEDERGMKTDSPVVLINGRPIGQENGDVEPVAKAEGIKVRKKRKA